MNAITAFLSLLGASSLVTGALGIWQKYLADRFIERIKQTHSKDLEEVRNAFQLQLKQFEATLNRRQLVTEAQFDVEFTSMREAYDLASKVLLGIRVIRPAIEHSPVGEDETGYKLRLQERVGALSEEHNNLLAYHESNRPFIAEEVYAGLVAMSRAARFEVSQVWAPYINFRSLEWYVQGEKNVNDCEAGHQQLIVAIRDRLRKLEIA